MSGARTRRDVVTRPINPIELVRWKATQDGWEPVTVHGVLVGVDAHHYILESFGIRREYPRDVWMETIP